MEFATTRLVEAGVSGPIATFFAEKVWLLPEYIDIKHGLQSGKMLADTRPKAVICIDIRRIAGDCIESSMVRDEDRPLGVELLRDDSDLRQPEYFLRPNDRIQRPETSIVEINLLGGHTFGDKLIFHISRLFITENVIVSAHEKIIRLPLAIKFSRCCYPILKKQVGTVVRQVLLAAQHESHGAMGNGMFVRIGPASRGAADCSIGDKYSQ